MHRILFAAVVLWFAVDGALSKPPPLPPKTMPGKPAGTVSTEWLAPHVSRTRLEVGDTRTTIIRWFSKEGRPLRELSGAKIGVQPGFAYDYSVEDVLTVFGVNDDWSFAALKDRHPGGYMTSTADSRTFVHQFHPAKGKIAVDVYFKGKLVHTLGAYWNCRGGSVTLGQDGSLAFLIATEDDQSKAAQVVVTGQDGKVRFEVKCEENHFSPIPAPDGAGVLLQPESGRDRFDFYTKKGKTSSFKLDTGAAFVAWLPDQTAALFRSEGRSKQWTLIDCQKGEPLWQVDDPAPTRVIANAPTAVAWKDLFLISGARHWKIGTTVRCIDALDAKTGKPVASWLPDPVQELPNEGRFVQLGEELYFVTRDEFSQIRAEEIRNKKNGWN